MDMDTSAAVPQSAVSQQQHVSSLARSPPPRVSSPPPTRRTVRLRASGGVPGDRQECSGQAQVVCISCKGRDCSVTGMCHNVSDGIRGGGGGHVGDISLNATGPTGHTLPRPLPLPGVSSAGTSTGNRESVDSFNNFQEFSGFYSFNEANRPDSLEHMVEAIITRKFGNIGLAQGGNELQRHHNPSSDGHVMPAGQEDRPIRERARLYEDRVDPCAHDNQIKRKANKRFFQEEEFSAKGKSFRPTVAIRSSRGERACANETSFLGGANSADMARGSRPRTSRDTSNVATAVGGHTL